MSSYLSEVLIRVPQVLSLIDREKISKTFGSGDRVHWGWKFTDFPGARYQEYLYSLSWLYSASSFDNPWRQNQHLLETIEGGFTYWNSIQRRNGSFDEAYPYENSLAATAFTVFYLSEAYGFLRDALSSNAKSRFLDSLERAGTWLTRNDETHGVLSNHLAAAAVAVHNAGSIIGNDSFLSRADHFVQRIFDRQSAEGWYEEYGGPDIGYQTHGSFYLACLWQKTKKPEILDSLRRANKFLMHFVQPDGSVGGEYASRNTTFYFPAAFEILYSDCEASRALAENQYPAVSEHRTVGLRQMDVQNLFPMLNNYIVAHEARHARPTAGQKPGELPWQKPGEWNFPDAGLFVRSTDVYFLIIGASKGGVIKIWDKIENNLIFQSCGYLTTNGGRKFSSQAINNATFRAENNTLAVKAQFVRVNQKVFSPWLFVCFRVFALTLGRSPFIAKTLKNLLVRTLVSKQEKIPLWLDRTVRNTRNSVVIEDKISGSERTVSFIPKFSSIHMGSSRYAHVGEELSLGLTADSRVQLNFNSSGVMESGKVVFNEN